MISVKMAPQKIITSIKMTTLAKTGRISILRILEINPRIATIRGAFTQEKHWNFTGILTFVMFQFALFLSYTKNLHNSFKSNCPQSWWKPTTWQSLEGETRDWNSFKAPSQRIAIIDLSSSSLEDITWRTILIWSDSELSLCKQHFSQEQFLKTIRENNFNISGDWVVNNSKWGEQQA